MDEEANPFDKDWESFPPEELADHCGISDLFYWRRYDEDPAASPQVENPWAKLGPERKVRACFFLGGGRVLAPHSRTPPHNV